MLKVEINSAGITPAFRPTNILTPELEVPLNNVRLLDTYLDTRSILAFSVTSTVAKNMASETIKKKLLIAVVYGDEDLASKIIKFHPKLLLDTSATAIDPSGKKIQGQTPLQAAISAGDVDMVQRLKAVLQQNVQRGIKLSFDPESEIQRQIIAVYPDGIDSEEETQKVQAKKFKDSMLMDLFNKINIATPEQVEFELNNPGQDNADSLLNAALHNFRAQFTSTSNQERIFNIYYLLAAFELNDEQFNNFNGDFDSDDKWNRRRLFWRQVIGYIQRHLPACYLQAFAQGIYDIVKHQKKLKRSFKFIDEKDLYMCAVDGDLKLGYEYVAGNSGRQLVLRGFVGWGESEIISKFIADKKIRLKEFMNRGEDNKEVIRNSKAATRFTPCFNMMVTIAIAAAAAIAYNEVKKLRLSL